MKVKLIDLIEREVDIAMPDYQNSVKYWSLKDFNKPIVHNEGIPSESINYSTTVYNKLIYRTNDLKDKIVYISSNFAIEAPSLFNDLISDYQGEVSWQKFRNDNLQADQQKFKASIFYKLYKLFNK